MLQRGYSTIEDIARLEDPAQLLRDLGKNSRSPFGQTLVKNALEIPFGEII